MIKESQKGVSDFNKKPQYIVETTKYCGGTTGV
jgi:hypothetical protein